MRYKRRHWLALDWILRNTQADTREMSEFLGVSEDYVAVMASEMRKHFPDLPKINERVLRGRDLMRNVPKYMYEFEPTRSPSSTKRRPTRKSYVGREHLFETRHAPFDPVAHREARHYKGNFDL